MKFTFFIRPFAFNKSCTLYELQKQVHSVLNLPGLDIFHRDERFIKLVL